MGRPPRIHREQILEAARQAFTATGFASTTLAGIASTLGVTAAAILRHYPSKQELFLAAMSERGLPLPPPVEELATVDGATDPRNVLRRFAEEMVPFVSLIIRPAIAVQMHVASQQTTVTVPFDTSSEETPPRKGLRIVADYFRRAMDAGTIRRGDPRALALLFAGHLQGYVFIHYVLNVTPVFPLATYVDALIDLWVEGAILGGSHGRNTRRTQKTDSGTAPARRGGGGVRVHARATKAKAAGPVRKPRSKDGQRRVPGGRPRSPRSRR